MLQLIHQVQSEDLEAEQRHDVQLQITGRKQVSCLQEEIIHGKSLSKKREALIEPREDSDHRWSGQRSSHEGDRAGWSFKGWQKCCGRGCQWALQRGRLSWTKMSKGKLTQHIRIMGFSKWFFHQTSHIIGWFDFFLQRVRDLQAIEIVFLA